MSKATPTTNAMRMLSAAKIPFEVLTYAVDESDLSGTHIATEVGLPMDMVFKTLVAKGDKTGYLVFCIPVDHEIDLKRAAQATGNKRVEMIHVKELLPLTGYIRGGCSPIGMKKKFPTYFHASAKNLEKITVSAGMRGAQLYMDREVLVNFVAGSYVDIAVKAE